MEIIKVAFEKPLKIVTKGQEVQVILFKTPDHGNIKIGVEAPRNLNVDREEIFYQKKERMDAPKQSK